MVGVTISIAADLSDFNTSPFGALSGNQVKSLPVFGSRVFSGGLVLVIVTSELHHAFPVLIYATSAHMSSTGRPGVIVRAKPDFEMSQIE